MNDHSQYLTLRKERVNRSRQCLFFVVYFNASICTQIAHIFQKILGAISRTTETNNRLVFRIFYAEIKHGNEKLYFKIFETV